MTPNRAQLREYNTGINRARHAYDTDRLTQWRQP